MTKKEFNSDLENIMGEKTNQWWGWDLNKEISGSFSDYLIFMLCKPIYDQVIWKLPWDFLVSDSTPS